MTKTLAKRRCYDSESTALTYFGSLSEALNGGNTKIGIAPDLGYSRHNELSGHAIPFYDAFACMRTAQIIVNDMLEAFAKHPELSSNWFKIFSRPQGFAARHPATQLVAHCIATNADLNRVPGFPNLPDKIVHYLNVFNMMLSWDYQRPHISIEAETQWGKTILCVVCILFYKAYLYATNMRARAKGHIDRKEMVFICTMNRNATADTTSREYEGAHQLLGDVMVELGDRMRVPLYEAVTEFDADQGRIASMNRANTGKGIIKRTAMKNFDPYFDRAVEAGYTHVTLMIDEADSAANIDSILARTMEKFKQAGIELRFIAISATPKSYCSLSKFRRYQIQIDDPHYTGLFQGTRMPVYGLTQFCKLAQIDPKLPETVLIGEIMKAMVAGVADPTPQYPQYSHARLNGQPFNGGCGMMIRFDRTSDAEVILDKYAKWLKQNKIAVLRYYTGYFKRQMVNGVWLKDYRNQSELVHDAMAKGVERFLLVMIDSGRRADRIPSECTVNIDLTAKFTTETAGEQGTIGRTTGFKEISQHRAPLVLLSDRNKDWVDLVRALYDSDPSKEKRSVMRVATNTITDVYARSVTRSVATLEANDPEVANFVARIDRVVTPHVTVNQKSAQQIADSKARYANAMADFRANKRDRPPNRIHSDIVIKFETITTRSTPSRRDDHNDHVHIGRDRQELSSTKWFFRLLDPKTCNSLDAVVRSRLGSEARILRPGETTTPHDTSQPKTLYHHPDHPPYINLSVGNFERKGHRAADELVHLGQRASGGRGAWGKTERQGASVRQAIKSGKALTVNLMYTYRNGVLRLKEVNVPLQAQVVVKPNWTDVATQLTMPNEKLIWGSGRLFMDEGDRQTRTDMIENMKKKAKRR